MSRKTQKRENSTSTSKQNRKLKRKRKRGTRKQIQVPLVKQMKDNPWMEEILKRKANGLPLHDYDKYLYSKMKQQPLPKGGITKLIQKYK
jgi:hypothetical protein